MFARRYVLLLLSLGLLGCGRAQGDQEVQPMNFVLSTAEVQMARRLAEEHLALPSSLGDRVYFIKVDLLPEVHAESALRHVMVLHYRYQGDETIFSLVDLRTREVVKVETALHYPTALASEEKARAAELARQDMRVRPFVENGAEFEFRPVQHADASDTLFGHRVVHVLLRGREGYISRPRVQVDLTTDSVYIAE